MTAPLFPSDAELEQLLVGPQSVAWRFGSDARLYLGMLYPLLLQVAHPTVGAGVRDYSNFEERPWERLLRSLDWVNLLIYGGHDAVAA
ncbi:MAG TPA: oxygenase MpaB family protein, partial [Candidatus Dormibacteraeota bacterium]